MSCFDAPHHQAAARPGRRRVLDFAGWAIFLSCALFVAFWLAPRKGVDFADEGWYLQAALTAASGQGFDSLLPQAPFYLVNAGLMKLGLSGYLGQRLAYYALCAASLLLLGAGLSRDGWRGFTTPLGAAIGFFCPLTTIISYENAPALFGASAMGLSLLAGKAEAASARYGLAILAGLALSLAAFVNFTVIPAAACCAAFFLLASGVGPGSAGAAVFLAVFGASACWYLGAIGFAEFTRPPGETHGFNLEKAPEMLAYAGQWAAVFIPLFGATALYARRRSRLSGLTGLTGRTGRTGAPLVLLRLATLAVCLGFAVLMARRAGFLPLAPLGPPDQDLSALFAGLGLPWIGDLPDQLQFQLVLFLGFAAAWLTLAGTFEKTRHYAVFALCVTAIGAFWFIQTFLSASAVSLRPFFAAPLFTAALSRQAFFEDERGGGFAGRAALFTSSLLILGCCLMYSVSYTHPGATVPAGEKTVLTMPGLEGVMEDPERAALLDELAGVYAREDCRDKTVLVFRFANLLHFIFRKKAPPDLSYILPSRRYPEERIFAALEDSPGWCVFVTRNNEFDPGWEKTEPLQKHLENASRTVIRLGRTPKRHLYDDFTVYVGPK